MGYIFPRREQIEVSCLYITTRYLLAELNMKKHVLLPIKEKDPVRAAQNFNFGGQRIPVYDGGIYKLFKNKHPERLDMRKKKNKDFFEKVVGAKYIHPVNKKRNIKEVITQRNQKNWKVIGGSAI